MNKWLANRLPIRDSCSDSLMNTFEAANHKVNLEDMQGIFFVLFLGYITGALFLVCELFRHHRRVSKERKLIRPFIE